MSKRLHPRGDSDIHSLLEKARDTLLAAHAAMPAAEEVATLRETLQPAVDRGYLFPDEDAEFRQLFVRYLHVRTALHDTLHSMRPLAPRWWWSAYTPQSLQAFVAAWLAGCMLMRSARYVVNEFHDEPMIRTLLNQAEPLYAIPAGTLDLIYLSSTRPSTLLRYLRAARFAEQHAEKIDHLRDDPLTGPLVTCLQAEQPYIEIQKRQHAGAYARCRFHRIRSKPSRHYKAVMWGLFEASGRAIAEMRNPFHRKRVRRAARKRVFEILQPGDILITRHDDALSNLFLPGFWPHAALIIGTAGQRETLGVSCSEDRVQRSQPPICILEAKKDGVRFRSLRETLRVDAFMLLRPRFIDTGQQRECIERALAHEGKLYDFEFDFTRSDRLVCTEVVYRALGGKEGFHFDLLHKAGRFALPAEDLITQGLKSGFLDILLLYGLKGNQLVEGPRAEQLVRRSIRFTA
ncbi:MAG: YiiX/YebB-like N1pC/P60 family cysteine hydrolase [Kiritimatiellia bacterium]